MPPAPVADGYMATLRAEVWEPWQPCIGDRVHIRVHGDCLGQRNNPERKAYEGLIATVISVEPGSCGHFYRVKVDGDLLPPKLAAAMELDPLEWWLQQSADCTHAHP